MISYRQGQVDTARERDKLRPKGHDRRRRVENINPRVWDSTTVCKSPDTGHDVRADDHGDIAVASTIGKREYIKIKPAVPIRGIDDGL
jgi:hypothetical protein